MKGGLVSQKEMRFFADKVSRLADELDQRVYFYSTTILMEVGSHAGSEQPPRTAGSPTLMFLESLVEEKDPKALLPVSDVLNTIYLYRPWHRRCHRRSTKLGKMVYRSEGWMWPGSILLYQEDDPLVYLMSEKRLTIDQIQSRFCINPKRRRKRKIGPFLPRNVRRSVRDYSSATPSLLDIPFLRGLGVINDLVPNA